LSFAGSQVAWHSLYLHIGVETGVIGFIALTLLLLPLLWRGFICWRSTGDSVPLIGLIGFMVIGLSVSGFDASSGVFLGLGLLGTRKRSSRTFRAQRDNQDITNSPWQNRAQ
jgi:O-antigen ligase